MTKTKTKQTSKPPVRNNPVSITRRIGSQAPKLSTSQSGTRCQNREVIADVTGSEAFKSTRIYINPGLSNIPWLSNVARRFTKYKFRDLRFEFVPSRAVTTTPGRMYLAAELNPNDAAPQNVAHMTSYRYMESGPVYGSLTLKPPVSAMFDGVQHKKVRCGPVGSDLSLYDGMALTFATHDVTGFTDETIGQLYIHYDVELFSPQLQNDGAGFGAQTIQDIYASRTNQVLNVLGTWQDIALGVPYNNGPGLNQVSGSPGAYTGLVLPCGKYLVTAQMRVVYDDNCQIEFRLSTTGGVSYLTRFAAEHGSWLSASEDTMTLIYPVVVGPNSNTLSFSVRDTTLLGGVEVPLDSFNLVIKVL